MRHGSFALVLLLGLGLATPASAQDEKKKKDPVAKMPARVREILAKADARMYWQEGRIKDLRVEIDFAELSDVLLKGGRLVYYVKVPPAPAVTGTEQTQPQQSTAIKTRLRVEGVTGEDPLAKNLKARQFAEMAGPSLGMLLGFADDELNRYFNQLAEHLDFEVVEKDGQLIITVTPQENAPQTKALLKFSKIVFTVDATGKMLKQEFSSSEMGRVEMIPGYIVRDEKLLLSTLQMKRFGMAVDATVDWQLQAGKHWLPVRFTQEVKARGIKIQWQFKKYKVNQGIADSVFTKK